MLNWLKSCFKQEPFVPEKQLQDKDFLKWAFGTDSTIMLKDVPKKWNKKHKDIFESLPEHSAKRYPYIMYGCYLYWKSTRKKKY